MKSMERQRAESLRQQGRSIKEIARELDVSQSTVSRWCADITLSAGQRKRLEKKRRAAGLKALAPWIRRNRELKRNDMSIQRSKGRADLGKITKRDLFMLGLGLYWGEGYKRGSQELGFTNSDPKMVRAILAWLRECYGVRIESIIARLTVNQRYKVQAEHLVNMWSHKTGIPRTQFGKPTFISGYNRTKLPARLYRGTLRLKVRRGTSLRRRILASIANVRY